MSQADQRCVQTWRNAEAVRPQPHVDVLGLNRCDGFRIVSLEDRGEGWAYYEFASDGPSCIQFWTDLPDAVSLVRELQRRSNHAIEFAAAKGLDDERIQRFDEAEGGACEVVAQSG